WEWHLLVNIVLIIVSLGLAVGTVSAKAVPSHRRWFYTGNKSSQKISEFRPGQRTSVFMALS
ncbi:MAG TPA: hypothetical protein PKA53_06930, partial [Sphingobacterium sp.]|nr:hypothetical protein [Sphingobacterium sp.]